MNITHPWLVLVFAVLFLTTAVVFFLGLLVVLRPSERAHWKPDDWAFWKNCIIVMLFAIVGLYYSI